MGRRMRKGWMISWRRDGISSETDGLAKDSRDGLDGRGMQHGGRRLARRINALKIRVWRTRSIHAGLEYPVKRADITRDLDGKRTGEGSLLLLVDQETSQIPCT